MPTWLSHYAISWTRMTRIGWIITRSWSRDEITNVCKETSHRNIAWSRNSQNESKQRRKKVDASKLISKVEIRRLIRLKRDKRDGKYNKRTSRGNHFSPGGGWRKGSLEKGDARKAMVTWKNGASIIFGPFVMPTTATRNVFKLCEPLLRFSARAKTYINLLFNRSSVMQLNW